MIPNSNLDATRSQSDRWRHARALSVCLIAALMPIWFCGCAATRPIFSRNVTKSDSVIRTISFSPQSASAPVFESLGPNEGPIVHSTGCEFPSIVECPSQSSYRCPEAVFVEPGCPCPQSRGGRRCPECGRAMAQQISFKDDLHKLPGRWLEDIEALATVENAAFLGTAAAGSLVLRNNVDPRVAHDTDEHGPRWNNFSDALADAGEAIPYQVSLLAGMYTTSLWKQDEELHELTLTMFTSYKFSFLTSVALQYATRTHTEGGGIFNSMTDSGFPSEQSATSFAMAAVADTKYGWKVGVPAYLAAGLISWGEVDQHRHTVSDVFFGAALGYAIGKTFAARQYNPQAQWKLVPLVDPLTSSQGMGFEYRY